jgi:transcription elongation factor Elf1
MIVENRQLIEPKDVVAIQFECEQCKARISFSLTENREPEPLIKCKICGAEWITPHSQEHDALRQFVDGLSRIRPAMQGRRVKLALEVPDTRNNTTE